MTTSDTPVGVVPGDRVRLVLPYSEVCMHMRVAGRAMLVEVREGGAQILNDDGSAFSFPITHGEAGILTHGQDGSLYTYNLASKCKRCNADISEYDPALLLCAWCDGTAQDSP